MRTAQSHFGRADGFARDACIWFVRFVFVLCCRWRRVFNFTSFAFVRTVNTSNVVFSFVFVCF